LTYLQTHTRCHGFTLLELMVVLVLMGIILSMMTISVGDGGKYRELEEEAQRLKTLISMARDEVIMGSREWRIAFREDGYQFEDKQGTKKQVWVPINNKIFRPRDLPGYRLSISIEDQAYPSDEEETEEQKPEEDVIGLVSLYYSGEMMAFELIMEQEDGEDKFTLKANPFGELELISSRDEKV
jgi:general secretion pathway protein H